MRTEIKDSTTRRLSASSTKKLLFSIASLAPLLTLTGFVFAADIDVPNTTDSINKGRVLFVNLCSQCHGRDGKAQIDVVSNATDLTDPSGYKHGSDSASIVKSIRDGAGAVMPAWGSVLKDPADIGHLRNFIESLWPEAQRPPVVQ